MLIGPRPCHVPGGSETAAVVCILNPANGLGIMSREHALPSLSQGTVQDVRRDDVGQGKSGNGRLIDYEDDEDSGCRQAPASRLRRIQADEKGLSAPDANTCDNGEQNRESGRHGGNWKREISNLR